MAMFRIDEAKPLGRIAPEIYGHFSEHLGRCIYVCESKRKKGTSEP